MGITYFPPGLNYAQATGNPASATAGNPFIFPTLNIGSSTNYSTSTGLFTVTSAGLYLVGINSYSSTIANATIYVYNGAVQGPFISIYLSTVLQIAGSAIVTASVGDTLSVRPNNTIDLTDGSIYFLKVG